MKLKQELLRRERVQLFEGEWNEQVRGQVRDFITWEVAELRLCENQRKTLVKEISHINFTALINLDLEGNLIQSVEELTRVHMPYIRSLYLDNNNITSVAVVRKLAWAFLDIISIANNHLGDSKCMCEGQFPQMSLLIMCGTLKENSSFVDNCFPSKLQACSLEYLSTAAPGQFCFHRSIQQVLQQRWPYVCFQE